MNYKLQDIININHLKSILTNINDTFNFAVAIIDNSKKIITTSKWEKIFLELDQKNNKCLKEFEKSFEEIVDIIDYKIPPTLVKKCFQDISFIATPLFIENKHYGYILAGQFFLKKPDLEFYKKMAMQYGFEEKTYLKIISNIPVITKKEMENYLSFIHEYLELSITNYKLIHRNESYSDFDIKENKDIKKALIASEGRFKKLVESVIDYIYTVRIEKGKVISTSHGPGCVSVTGYTSEEYEKDQYLWYRMVYEEDRDEVIKQSSMMISGKQALPLEHRIIHKNGFIRWVRNTPVLRYNEKHAVIGYDGLIVDITDRKLVEETLKAQEEIFRLFMEYSPIYIFFKDENIRAIQLSRNYEKMLGKPLNEILGKTMDELFPSDMAKSMVAFDKHILDEGKPKEIIEELNGRIYSTLKFPIILNGKPTYLAGFTIDITERKRLEEILEKDKEELKLIIDSSPIVVFYKDKEGKFIRINKAFTNELNLPEEKFIGKTVFDFYSNKIAQSMTDDDNEVLSTKKPKHNIIEQVESVTGLRWVRTDKIPIFDKKGNPIGLIGFAQDITENKQAEELLSESEERFRTAFENANVGVCLVSTDGYLFKVNNMMSQIFGYSKEELEKINVNDIAYPEDRDLSPAFIKKAISGETEHTSFDKRYIHKNGHLIWGHVSSSIIRNSKGEPLYFISHVQDITERKKVEEALSASESRYRALIENQSELISRYTPDTILTFVNDSYCEFFGRKREELIGQSFMFMVAPEFHEKIKKETEDRAKNPRQIVGEYVNYRYDGKECWIQWVVQCIKDEKGQVVEFQAVGRDLTERKKVENDLLESEKKFRTFVETTKEWIWMIDLEGKHTYCNPAIKSILGYETDELIGVNSFKLMHPDDLVEVKEMVEKKTEEKKGWSNFIIRWQHKDGTFRYLESNAFPILDSDGNLKGFQGADRDITERKKAEQELIKFNEELEKRVQQRTEELINVNKELESFSYTVSHDLRAPLRSINGFSQILMEDYKDKLDEEALNYLKRIINSSNKLAELIDHLLNLSRITRSEVNKTKVDLSKMANDIIIELKELNPERIIDFICEKEIIVDADYALIHSALYNIIHNSWKYTSKKSKTKIEFGVTKKIENRVFYIKDNGVGFDMKYSNKLFKVFQRLHSDKEFEGSGIGLATVQHIINKHGGSTWAESKINKGTTIYFTLG